ncbi:MAG: radical SAM protein [Acidobacteriia bacterium]|nr:radical SAM protein [Terriglobia bacterium]
MNRNDVLQAWGRILSGRKPLLSIEITRECPLRCPGCYAYGDQHLGGLTTLRELRDLRGDALVRGVLELVDRLQPLHVSIVGGDPLVRYRELEELMPQLVRRGIFVQLVTSAFRPLPPAWAGMNRVQVVVSIDGLQPEHDARRKPATYERILNNIAGQRVTVHCTVTGLMLNSPDYLERFLDFWTARPEIERVWFSTFTPQKGEQLPEVLTRAQRSLVVREMLRLRPMYPKLDMKEETIREYEYPPSSPEQCVFAQTTETVSADLKTRITPCQFGGDPDCSQCGCVASMALAGVGRKKFAGVTLAGFLRASNLVGSAVARAKAA